MTSKAATKGKGQPPPVPPRRDIPTKSALTEEELHGKMKRHSPGRSCSPKKDSLSMAALLYQDVDLLDDVEEDDLMKWRGGRELRMAFRLLDKNKDGRISVSEFQVMLRNFGIQVPDEMVEEFITSKSRSGTGSLSENDFVAWVGSSVAAIPEDASKDLMAAFRVFDKDGNGFITRDELKEAMEMIGEPVTDEDIDNMITMADLNKDGKIDYEEFSKLLG